MQNPVEKRFVENMSTAKAISVCVENMNVRRDTSVKRTMGEKRNVQVIRVFFIILI